MLTRWMLLACLILALPAPVVAAEPLDPSELVGHWARVDAERDDALRNEAIERTTATLSLVLRGIARKLMQRSTRPPERYAIDPLETGIRIRPDDEEPFIALLNGEPDPSRDASVSSRPTEDGFIERWRNGDDNHGTTQWRLDERAARLRVTVTVHHARFQRPLVYSTTYRRVDPGRLSNPPTPSSTSTARKRDVR